MISDLKTRAQAARKRLTDPHWLAQQLGLGEGSLREGRDLKIRCPWHAESNPSCSLKLRPDGTLSAHCFSCDKSGDALHLIAHHLSLDVVRDFARCVEEAERLTGIAPPSAPPPKAKGRPDPAEVAALWAIGEQPGEDAALAARGLDAVQLCARGLVRVIPQVAALPRFARSRGRPWPTSGHRYLVRLFGATGQLESIHARALCDVDPKGLLPSGHTSAGLVLADDLGQELLRNRRAPAAGLLICEGVPDFWTLASHFSPTEAPAILGVLSGGWSEAIGRRIPDGTRVIVWTHTDASQAKAGQKYAARIAGQLQGRCEVRVITQDVPPGAKKAPDANDVLQKGGRAEIAKILAPVAIEQAPHDPEAWKRQLLYNDRGIKRVLANAITIFTQSPAWHEVLSWNDFRSRIEITFAPPWGENEMPKGGVAANLWGDADDVRAQAWLERNYDLSLSPGAISGALRVAAERNRYHPVREYLQDLRWDGTPRLRALFRDYFQAEASPYLDLVSLWWPVSAVARVFAPGCKVDSMIILEGEQGAGKSSALATLAVRKEWFLDSAIMVGEKDGYDILRGKWIIEFAELDSWRRADQGRLKQYITQASDSYRAAYGRHSADHLRQCVFAGTTNEDVYLEDPTGSRRFYPIRCGAIQLERLYADRDQLWAEALHFYRQKDFRWWPVTAQEHELCREAQATRYVSDVWEELIQNWLSSTTGMLTHSEDRLTTTMIATTCLDIPAERLTRGFQTRIGNVLRALGYEVAQRSTRKDRTRYYKKQ